MTMISTTTTTTTPTTPATLKGLPLLLLLLLTATTLTTTDAQTVEELGLETFDGPGDENQLNLISSVNVNEYSGFHDTFPGVFGLVRMGNMPELVADDSVQDVSGSGNGIDPNDTMGIAGESTTPFFGMSQTQEQDNITTAAVYTSIWTWGNWCNDRSSGEDGAAIDRIEMDIAAMGTFDGAADGFSVDVQFNRQSTLPVFEIVPHQDYNETTPFRYNANDAGVETELLFPLMVFNTNGVDDVLDKSVALTGNFETYVSASFDWFTTPVYNVTIRVSVNNQFNVAAKGAMGMDNIKIWGYCRVPPPTMSPTVTAQPTTYPTYQPSVSSMPTSAPTTTAPTGLTDVLTAISAPIDQTATGLFLPAVAGTQDDWHCYNGEVPLSKYTLSISKSETNDDGKAQIEILTSPPNLVTTWTTTYRSANGTVGTLLVLLWNIEVVQALDLANNIAAKTGIEVKFPAEQLVYFETCCGFNGQIQGADDGGGGGGFPNLDQMYIWTDDVQLDASLGNKEASNLNITVQNSSTAYIEFVETDVTVGSVLSQYEADVYLKANADWIQVAPDNWVTSGGGNLCPDGGYDCDDYSKLFLDGQVEEYGFVGNTALYGPGFQTTGNLDNVYCNETEWSAACLEVTSLANPVNVNRPKVIVGSYCPYREKLPPYIPWTLSAGVMHGPQGGSLVVSMVVAMTSVAMVVWQLF